MAFIRPLVFLKGLNKKSFKKALEGLIKAPGELYRERLRRISGCTQSIFRRVGNIPSLGTSRSKGEVREETGAAIRSQGAARSQGGQAKDELRPGMSQERARSSQGAAKESQGGAARKSQGGARKEPGCVLGHPRILLA